MKRIQLVLALAAFLATVTLPSCSKSGSTPPPSTLPKRLTEIWLYKNTPSQVGVKLTYDDQGRITKRVDGVNPSTYEEFTYTGAKLTGHKAYNNGTLSYDLTNSFTITDTSISERFIHTRASGDVTDTTDVSYGVSGSHITSYNVTVRIVGGHVNETGYLYQISGDELVSYSNRNVQDGVVLIPPSTVTVNAVDTHPNPFFEMGPLNQVLTTYGSGYLSKGKHNVTALAGGPLGTAPPPGTYLWIYDADGYPLGLRLDGATSDYYTFVYSR